MPGPVPKRSDERRRRNIPAGGPTVQVDLEAIADGAEADSLEALIALPIAIPEPIEATDEDDRGGWHPMARELWDSFSRSGQALFWEPSDWAIAKLICESLSRDLKPQFVGVTPGADGMDGEPIFEKIPLKGASLGAYLKAFNSLMLTEGDRRRLSIELERTRLVKPTGEDAKVVKITDRRQARLIAAQRKEAS